jgi:uncharacterized cupin superfamily protein
MIIRKGQPQTSRGDDGKTERSEYSDAGGLTQFGAYAETLQPGSISSERHWHEEEDEFLYVLSGEATVIEEDGAHLLRPGDAACWPAGVANAHQVVNRSDTPCTYLIFGTRMARDTVHYPDSGKTLHDGNGTWRLNRSDGTQIGGGEIEQLRPLTWWGSEVNRTPEHRPPN